jgi:hypothetical protein
MRGVQGAADRAVSLACEHLLAEAPGSRLHDVSKDPRFQHRGVDLLWERDGLPVLGVEVKGDRQGGRRGNFFFELVSNVEKDTPGCFLYSIADLLLYVFLDKREVHSLPMKDVRAWFLPRAKQYPLKSTKTRTGHLVYTTVGAIVPVREVLKEVAGVTRTKLT